MTQVQFTPAHVGEHPHVAAGVYTDSVPALPPDSAVWRMRTRGRRGRSTDAHTAVANLRGTSVYSVATPYNTLIVPAAHTALCARGVRSRRAITRPHIGRGRVSPVMAPGPRPRSRTYTATAEYTGPSNVARLTRQGTKPTHHPYWIGVYAVGVFRTFGGLRPSTGRLVCSACESR